MPPKHNTSFLKEHIKSLLKDHTHSDLTLSSKTRLYALHHLHVCTRSAFFLKACKFRKQSSTPSLSDSAPYQQDHSPQCGGTIDLSTSDPHAVDCLVQFLYLDDYDPFVSAQPQPATDDAQPNAIYPAFVVQRAEEQQPYYGLTLHARVYCLADFSQLPDLKLLAADKFTTLRPSPYQPLVDVPAFLKLVTEIYDHTLDQDTILRTAVAAVYKDNLRQLLLIEAADNLLVKYSHLARDIVRHCV